MIITEYQAWVNAVSLILYNKGYSLSDDSELWNEIEFLFEDDATPTEAADHILS